jgi:flagellar hook-length control protein FliK
VQVAVATQVQAVAATAPKHQAATTTDKASLTDGSKPPAAKTDSKPKDGTANATTAAGAAPIGTPAPVGATANAVPLADPSTATSTDGSTKTATDGNGAVSPLAAPTVGPQAQAHQAYAQANDRAALPQVTVDQVAMHLTKAASDGIDQLTIHLKPEHLGTIEVKLELKDDGSTKATISADRRDTLDLLQRDSHRLERALDNAGLKADPGSLSFNLRDGGSRYTPYTPPGNGGAPSRYVHTEELPPVNAAMLGYINSRVANGGVDIRV